MVTERKSITLVLTRACNLNCIYCYEHHKDDRFMSFETAKASLAEALDDDRFNEYEIDLFGGEPFLAFPLVKQIVEWTFKTYPTKKLIFMLTTNGTLVHGEIKEWLEKYHEMVVCSLSLDGVKHVHDMQRCHSYDDIDIAFFARLWPFQAFKATISQEALPYLAEDIIYFHENHYEFTCNLAMGISWADPHNEKVLEGELMKLVHYYLEHPDVIPCRMLNADIKMIALPGVRNDFRHCGAGVEMITYDVDGERYPCQFFMPSTLGEDNACKMGCLSFPDPVTKEHYPPMCRDCIVLSVCHNCYGANYTSTGSLFQKDPDWCRLQKICFKAQAYMLFRKYQAGQLSNLSETDLALTLKAIKMINGAF